VPRVGIVLAVIDGVKLSERTDSTAQSHASNRGHWRALLIVGYIVAVLLFSGLARADQGLLDGVVSIFGF
jgi:hypothetical protein